jgi:diguanylate cyclase (GGDEF)-like protein/PAS domain S-box-containing protein
MGSGEQPQILFVRADSFPDDPFKKRGLSRGHRVRVEPLRPLTGPSMSEAPPEAILFGVRDGEPADLRRLSEWAESYPDVSIVALIEGGDPQLGLKALSGGATCWLPSAVTDSNTIQRALDRAVAQHRQHVSLREEHERYRNLIECAPIGVFELKDGSLTYANEHFAKKLGYTQREVLNMRPTDFIMEDDRAEVLRGIERRGHGVHQLSPSVYRFRGKNGEIYIGEVHSRLVEMPDGPRIEGTILDITQETRLMRLHRAVLELGEVILGEQDIDRILQLVLDAITEHSGFRRAVLSLYDLSIPVPFEGDVYKILSSGLTSKERQTLLAQDPMPRRERQLAFAEDFRLGPAYYIPHDRTPFAKERGITGTVSIEGWHKDDFLFIPLRGMAGIIGNISVDDPVDRSAPTVASIEPVAYLANFAALAVERVYKLNQLRKHKDRLHGLWGLGSELAEITDVGTLCETAARRARDDMDYDFCSIWLVDGTDLVLRGIASHATYPAHEVPRKGLRVPIEGDGITRRAARFAESLVVPDVRTDESFRGQRASTRSAIVVPVIGKKRPLGAIEVESRRLAAFDDQDMEVLSALASQLAITISALTQRESLSRIFSFGQRVTAASTVDQVVTSTLDFLVEQFGYEMSTIFLADDQNSLVVAGLRGPYRERGVEPGWALPPGRGIIRWVAKSKSYALVGEVTSDPRYYEAFPGTRSELAVPVLFSGRLLGVLNLESPQLNSFDQEDRQLLEVIANHLAIALSNLSSQASLREQAIRDPLTGIHNRHYFNSIIATELSRSDRYDHPLSLMMVDIDGFRAVNNRLGHLKGDKVLKEVALILTESVRAADRVIRYGGDEFLIFMPETQREAEQVADRLRSRIGTVSRRAGIPDIPIGLSIGLYTRQPGETRSLESILEEVDRRMYEDKRAGDLPSR